MYVTLIIQNNDYKSDHVKKPLQLWIVGIETNFRGKVHHSKWPISNLTLSS